MATVNFHPQAQTEYREALSWYARRSRRAAQGFEREVDRILREIESAPQRYPFYDDVFRQAPLTRYPYSLLYHVESTGDVLVIAVAHSSREPGYWQSRS